MKVRVKFRKEGSLRFVGHLDTMRFFQKMIRRAEIPIAYSKGFNPHMIMSFANPLGIGVTSQGEYFDIELKEAIPSEEAMRRLNATSVYGIEVLSFKEIASEKKMNGMTILAAAGYLVEIKSMGEFQVKEINESRLNEKDSLAAYTDLTEMIKLFMSQSEINILKKTKRSEEVVNIKPLIYHIEAKESHSIEMILAAGSKENLKPGLVMEALCSYLGIEYDVLSFGVHRLEMYADVGNNEERKLVSLESLGKVI